MGHATSNLKNIESIPAAKQFGVDELGNLTRLFQNLARRSPNATINREHFLEFVQLPGLHGEQLFKAFDTKQTGVIDLEEFVTGLALICRGTREEKIRFMFEMYDLLGDGSVSKAELRALVNQVPRDRAAPLEGCVFPVASPRVDSRCDEESGIATLRSANDLRAEEPSPSPSALEPPRFEVPVHLKPRSLDVLTMDSSTHSCQSPRRRAYVDCTNDAIVDKAFVECDLDGNGRLCYEQFRMWLDRTPQMLKFLDDAFDQALGAAGCEPNSPMPPNSPLYRSDSAKSLSNLSYAPGPLRKSHGSSGSLSNLRYVPSDPSLHAVSSSNSLHRSASEGSTASSLGGILLSPEGLEPTEGEDFCGYLVKLGAKFSQRTKRYFALTGKCLYYYKKRGDTVPKGLIFLGGCTCTADAAASTSSSWAFTITHLDACAEGVRPATLFAASSQERDAWVAAVCAAIGTSSNRCDTVYDFGKVVGSGQFATVFLAEERCTGKKVAVKRIEKQTSDEDPEQLARRRVMFRTEVSIMRLTHHEHVLPLLAVFEDVQYVHLVTPLMRSDLSSRLERTQTFGEHDALRVCAHIFDAVAYLHALGIAHRDLKPENVLCNEDLDYDSIQVADFGISQVLRPEQQITDAAGTIEYTAPEVFLRKGCGFPADCWSVAVIGFLVLHGAQPFIGETKAETIGNILEVEIQCKPEAWLAFSAEARDFLGKILMLDPAQRITAREALEHPWIDQYVPAATAHGEPLAAALVPPSSF